MKKFAFQCSIFLPFILTSFFLLLPNVRADEYTYEINSSNFDLLFSNDFSIVKQYSDNYINNNGGDYVIYYRESNYRFLFFNSLYISNFYFSILSNKLRLSWSIPSAYVCNFVDNNFSCTDYSSQYNISFLILFNSDNIITSYPLLFSSWVIPYNFDYSISFNYFDKTYSLIANTSTSFPTLYDLYQEFNSSNPVPLDNTPILTYFYSTVGSKIGWLGEQIVSNYIYLAIIGVFILILIIELIRRYFL